jgi:hypothetical protein
MGNKNEPIGEVITVAGSYIARSWLSPNPLWQQGTKAGMTACHGAGWLVGFSSAMSNCGLIAYDVSYHKCAWSRYQWISLAGTKKVSCGLERARMGDGKSTNVRQHRLRVSVRELIVLIVLIGGCLGWVVRRARIQRELTAVVERAGGFVRYDWQFENGRFYPDGAPSRRRWMRDAFGFDYFDYIVAAHYERGSDAELMNIGYLAKLVSLQAAGSAVTDAALMHVKGLDNLQFLYLSNTSITDAGLAHLKDMTGLKELSLAGSRATDRGLAQLSRLTRLELLHLGRTGVTNSGLVSLKGMRNLEELHLEDCDITDAGLSFLRGLTSLQYLVLRRTQVTQRGVKELNSALPKLLIDR